VPRPKPKNGTRPKGARSWQENQPPAGEPDPKAQRNFTDPESRVLLTKDG
jgi:hypothetical protein